MTATGHVWNCAAIGLIHRYFCSTGCFLNVLGTDGGMKETVGGLVQWPQGRGDDVFPWFGSWKSWLQLYSHLNEVINVLNTFDHSTVFWYSSKLHVSDLLTFPQGGMHLRSANRWQASRTTMTFVRVQVSESMMNWAIRVLAPVSGTETRLELSIFLVGWVALWLVLLAWKYPKWHFPFFL